MPTFRIRDWDTHYENNRTRSMRRMSWVPIPVKLAGDGYTELVSGKDGAALYGCWVACVLVAASCEPRGTLLRGNGVPHDAQSLSRITRMPTRLIQSMLDAVQVIGWIDDAGSPHEGALDPAGIAHEGAGSAQVSALSGRKESEGRNPILASPQASAGKENGEMTEAKFRAAWSRAFERFYEDFPRKGHRSAALVKWMARAPAYNAAAKLDPQGVLRTRYGEFVDRLNEIIDEQAGNLDTGNKQYLPYADAFLNKEF